MSPRSSVLKMWNIQKTQSDCNSQCKTKENQMEFWQYEWTSIKSWSALVKPVIHSSDICNRGEMSQDLVASRPHFQKWAKAAFYSHFLHPMTTSLCGKIFYTQKKQRNHNFKSSLVIGNFVLSCLSETFNKNTITTSLYCHLRDFDCLLPCCQSFLDGRVLL